jgi:hypothetical protein
VKITDIPDTGEMWAACIACGEPILVVDRYITDRPPIPRFNPLAFIEFYTDEGGDPDTRVAECPKCGAWLDLDNPTLTIEAI